MSQTTELIRRLIGRGLTQIEIARRTGIPQPRLSRWQRGDAPEAADDALKLVNLENELALERQNSMLLTTAQEGERAAA